MIIEIEDNHCKVTMETNGIKRQKITSLTEIISRLGAYQESSFGLLPRNLRYMETVGNVTVLGLEFPKMKREVKTAYYNEHTERDERKVVSDVEFPAGVLFAKLNKEPDGSYSHINSFMFALKGNRISFPNDPVFVYPAPNIYDYHKICWGAVEIPRIRTLLGVEGLVGTFFANSFNNDLFGGKFSEAYGHERRSGDSYAFFEKSAEHGFDEAWLRPVYNKTIKDIAPAIMKGDLRGNF